MVPEVQIIKGCKDGKRQSFNLLYTQYAPIMMGVCFRYAKNRTEAEDLLQEGFIKIFNNINSFEGKGSFEGWMKRIMINSAINNFKKRKKEPFFEEINQKQIVEHLHEEDDFIFIELSSSVRQVELIEMIQSLPEGYRMIFNMHVIEGMMHQQIAEALDISVNTSKSQLSKARGLLKKKLNQVMIKQTT